DLAPDFRVLAVTLSAAILTGIFFGLLPAWRSSREDPALLLQQNARNLGGGSGKLGKLLIVAQVALSLILLLGAGLFVRSFQRLRSVNFGFDESALLEVTLNPQPGGYDHLDMNSYHRQLLQRIAAIPGVTSVSYADISIPAPQLWHELVSPSSADPNTGVHFSAGGATVSSNFFHTLGISLLGGRELSDADDQTILPLPSSAGASPTGFSRGAMPLAKLFALVSCPIFKTFKSSASPRMPEFP